MPPLPPLPSHVRRVAETKNDRQSEGKDDLRIDLLLMEGRTRPGPPRLNCADPPLPMV